MKYLALLRGINVGGQSLLKMSALRSCLEVHGFREVTTYIQSGNVLFDSDESDLQRLEHEVEQALSTINCFAKVVVKSSRQLERIVSGAPAEWSNSAGLRRDVAFIKKPFTAASALKDVAVTNGVDSVTAANGVLYMTTVMKELKRSSLPKLIRKPVYQAMTIRSLGTCQRLLGLMRPTPVTSRPATSRPR